jgi:LuxR family transcriptional regulator, maltose regulon positive regulatory protein
VDVRGPAAAAAAAASHARLIDASHLVTRERLLSRLELAARERLTLLVAPSGTGKSVLLAEWVATRHPPRPRWLTFDGLAPPERSINDLLAALDPDADGRGDDRAATVVLPSADLLRRLVDDALAKLADQPPMTLIIDDLHRLSDPLALEAVRRLIENGPRSLRLVMATQYDLPLLFYRRRLDDEILELRQEDLAFQREEAAELLRRVSGRPLTLTQVDALRERAEGWAMALRLAAVALRDAPDPDQLIDAVTSSERFVADYLAAEVLGQQSEPRQRFLLTTSVLDLLHADLCDRLLDREDSQAMLSDLERTSLFVTRLPGPGGWWRYHQLFRALLRHRLRARDPEGERQALLRAASWHIERHEDDVATRYLAEAGAWERIMEQAQAGAGASLLHGNVAVVSHALAQVPDEVRRTRPAILLLAAAARVLGSGTTSPEVDLDASDTWRPEEVLVAALLRGYHALRQGEPAAALDAADRVLDGLEGHVPVSFPNVFGLTGDREDLAAAARMIRGACALYRADATTAEVELAGAITAGSAVWHVAALGYRALLAGWAGELRAAEEHARRAIELARQLGPGLRPMTVPARLANARIARARGEPDAAASHLGSVATLLDEHTDPVLTHLFVTEQAGLLVDPDLPEDGLHSLAVRQHRQPLPRAGLAWVHAERQVVEVQLLLASGDLAGAERTLGPPPDRLSDLANLRMIIALDRADDAAAHAVLSAWPDEPAPRAAWERRIWLAVLRMREGDDKGACQLLDQVVGEARLVGHLGVFAAAGRHVQPIARALHRSDPNPFLRAITELAVRDVPPSGRTHLVEPLTGREEALLALLPSRLTNTEIAAACDVSLNTVKTHLKHIYRKLGATNRREAVAAAEHLRLL